MIVDWIKNSLGETYYKIKEGKKIAWCFVCDEWDESPQRIAENLGVDITSRTEFHDLPQIIMMIWNNFINNGMEPVDINKMMDGCEIDMNSLIPYQLDIKKKDGCLWAMPRIVDGIYRDYDII